jgi:hypothetical protein
LHDAVDPFVVAPKEREGGSNIFLATKIEADPPRVRKVMVGRGFATGYKFIAHGARERQISHSVAMEMAELQFANAKFAPAEAMLSHCDPRPAKQFAFDYLFDFNASFHSSVFSRVQDARFIPPS